MADPSPADAPTAPTFKCSTLLLQFWAASSSSLMASSTYKKLNIKQ